MSETGPLPAQPYILVLWATHIGRYAIKHSPSGARERAIVKVLGTLCEHSPSSSFSLSFSWSLLLALPVPLVGSHVSLCGSSYFSCSPWWSLAPSLTLFPDVAPPLPTTGYHPSRAPALSPHWYPRRVGIPEIPPSPPVVLSSTKDPTPFGEPTELRNRLCSRMSWSLCHGHGRGARQGERKRDSYEIGGGDGQRGTRRGEERLWSCQTTRHCAVAPSTPLAGTPRVDSFLLNYLHERDAGPKYSAAITGLETMRMRRVCELRFALRQR